MATANSIGNYVDAMFTSYYNECGAYGAGIIDKNTAFNNFNNAGDTILSLMALFLVEQHLSDAHLETVRAMKGTLLHAITNLP